MIPATPLALLTDALTLTKTLATADAATAEAAILTLFATHEATRAACVLALALTILAPPDSTPLAPI